MTQGRVKSEGRVCLAQTDGVNNNKENTVHSLVILFIIAKIRTHPRFPSESEWEKSNMAYMHKLQLLSKITDTDLREEQFILIYGFKESQSTRPERHEQWFSSSSQEEAENDLSIRQEDLKKQSIPSNGENPEEFFNPSSREEVDMAQPVVPGASDLNDSFGSGIREEDTRIRMRPLITMGHPSLIMYFCHLCPNSFFPCIYFILNVNITVFIHENPKKEMVKWPCTRLTWL